MDVVLLSPANISVIIPNDGRRPKELAQIREYLELKGFEDIIIAGGNHKMQNRYDAVKQAKYDVIYTQDDDCIVTNIQDLIDNYDKHKITCNAKLERVDYYERLCRGKIALVGYGSIFHKSLVGNMEKYFSKFGHDKDSDREADRIFTWCNEKNLIIADRFIIDFPTAMTGMSIDTDHYVSMYMVMDRLKLLK